MALSVIPYLLGKNLTDVSITPLTEDDAGALTAGSTASIHGLIKDVDFEPTTNTDDIRGVNMDQANAVPQDFDATLNFTVQLRRDSNQALLDAWSYTRFLIVVRAGRLNIQFYGTGVGLPIRVDSRGANAYRLSYKQFVPWIDGAEGEPVTVTES